MQLTEYTSYNQKHKKRLVFHFGENAGFYSEFNNMVLGIAYCLLHNIRFQMYSDDAVFRTDKGWNDYFLPFCEEKHCILHHLTNKRANRKKTGRQRVYRVFNQIFNPHLYLTSDLWYEFRNLDKTLENKAYRLFFPESESLQDVCAEIIGMIYRFNDSTQKEIDQSIATLNIKGEYVGFHIRGGDKIIEHKLLEVKEYIDTAEKTTNIRQAYVFTDDYSAFELLCAEYPQWRFFTLASSDDEGYFHKQFIKLPVEVRRAKMIYMFSSIELLSQARHNFCTYSSNVGMFLGMRVGDKTHGVDFEKWFLW
jgi:hypothetical protein